MSGSPVTGSASVEAIVVAGEIDHPSVGRGTRTAPEGVVWLRARNHNSRGNRRSVFPGWSKPISPARAAATEARALRGDDSRGEHVGGTWPRRRGHGRGRTSEGVDVGPDEVGGDPAGGEQPSYTSSIATSTASGKPGWSASRAAPMPPTAAPPTGTHRATTSTTPMVALIDDSLTPTQVLNPGPRYDYDNLQVEQ
jgi:hypothetical protein